MTQPNVKNIKAWAIWLGLSDFDKRLLEEGRSSFLGHGYLGVYDSTYSPPTRQAGCPTALFRTRIDARAHVAARKLKLSGWPRAKVVRVIVSIQPR